MCVYGNKPHSSSAGVSNPPGSKDDVSAATHKTESERADLEKEIDKKEEDEALSHDLLDVLYVSLDNMHLQT
jgi:hypothetical protein